MAHRHKLRAVEGDVCWFCKQPADSASWMDLGELKSTQDAVFEGTHYILYHECCAVYSNGAEVPPSGMDDQSVLQFWLHGERCSGIGLKCQLCGLRGATTGCLHGPCQQFYHYPCARVRAFQGHLQFSRSCRALACDKHLSLLPHPAEDEFLGMWMEGAGAWNGRYKYAAAASWQPYYDTYITDFLSRWQHLLNMVPLEQLKAQKQEKKKHRRSSRGGRTSADGGDSDPEFRVGRRMKGSHGGRGRGGGRGHKQQHGGNDAAASNRHAAHHQLQKEPLPQRIGVPPEIAEAVSHGAGKHPSRAVTANGFGSADYRSSGRDSQDGGSDQQYQQQLRHADTDLLLKAAGFATTASASAQQQQEGSSFQQPEHMDALEQVLSGDHSAQAAAAAALMAAAVVAAARDTTSSRTVSSAAHPGAAAAGVLSRASSADSAPAHKEPDRSGAAAGESDTRGAGHSAGVGSHGAASAGKDPHEAAEAAAAAAEHAAEDTPTSAGPKRRPGAFRSPAGPQLDLPVRQTARYNPQSAADAGVRTAADRIFERIAGHRDQSDSSAHAGYSAGTHQGPSAAGGCLGADDAAASSRRLGGKPRRRYLDVNLYASTGQKHLSFEPELDAASQQRRQASAVKQPRQQSKLSPLHTAGVAPPAAAPNLPGWPGNRGLDMFSWLQQQVQQQQQQTSMHSGDSSRGLGSPMLQQGSGAAAINGSQGAAGMIGAEVHKAAAAGGAPIASSDNALQRAADAVAAAAASLGSGLDRSQKDRLLATIEALAQATRGGGAAAIARESSTQVQQQLRESPFASPGDPLTHNAAADDGNACDSGALVPAVAELLKVLGKQMSGQQQQSVEPASPSMQRQTGIKRPHSLDQYGGIEAANAAAAATASAGMNALSSPLSTATAAAGRSAGYGSLLLPQMPEYFGCVTALPPLQPGELRAGGVTAHPNLVSMYVKQDMEKALALQAWSVVIPPSALRKLRNSGIEPGHLASQLYQLLHASNVLNHHSTNATAANGRGTSGGMCVSGGYAGMPQDFPVRFVQGCMVAGDHPRVGLHGEFTLTAMQDIEAGTIIGPWRCYVLTQDDYTRLQVTVPPDWQHPEGQPRAHAWQELLHRYTLPAKVPYLATDDPYGKVLTSNAPVLYFCALGFGNLTCLVNDPVLDPMAAAASADADCVADANVEMCVVLVNGLPMPVLVTTQEVKRGQEVLCSYGRPYWQMWADFRAGKTSGAADDGIGQQGL